MPRLPDWRSVGMVASSPGHGVDYRQVYQNYAQILRSILLAANSRGGVILGTNSWYGGHQLAGNLCLRMGASLVEYGGAVDRIGKLFCR